MRRSGRRALILRLIVLAVAAVSLYYLWPQLIEIFGALPGLSGIRWFWFAFMIVLEVASFACYWGLMRIALDERRWGIVALAQLASTAFSRVVPGGTASGGAVTYRMFAAAGLPRGRVATGVTATTLLSTAVLFCLPVFSLPAIIGGAAIDRTLLHGLEFGLAIAALIVAGGTIALFTDRPVAWVGRSVARVRLRLRAGGRQPDALAARLLEERDIIKNALGSRWWQALPLAAGGWLFDFATLLAALAALGAQVRPSLALLAYVVAALLAVIPLTPGGLGFVEVGLAAMLGLAGVGAAEATTAVLAYRLVSFWMPIPTGLIATLVFRWRYERRPRRAHVRS